MRRAFWLLVAAVAGWWVLVAPAGAQGLTAEVTALRGAMAAVNQACTADPDGVACGVAVAEATPLVTTALVSIGETRDRARYGAGMRTYLAAAVPEVRAAAAFALARLFPDESDTPALLALLMEPIGGVRIAAAAALRESGDPVARALADRAGEELDLSFAVEGLPYDPAAVAGLLPADAAYVPFERDEVGYGALLFVSEEAPAAAVARLVAAADGRAAIPGRSVPDRIRYDGAVSLLSQNRAFADVSVVVLEETDSVIRLGFVYRDVQLGRTGVALAYEPARAMPQLRETGAAQVTAAVSLPTAAELFDGPAAVRRADDPPAFVAKEGAAADETELYLAVVAGEGIGAADYLTLFPHGAYRPEVEALLDDTLVVELAQYRVAPSGVVVVTLRNMPGHAEDRLAIMPPEAPDDEVLQVFPTGGITDGTITIAAPSRAGERELRVYFGGSDAVQRRVALVVDAAVAGQAGAGAGSTPANNAAVAPVGGRADLGGGQGAGAGAIPGTGPRIAVDAPVYAGTRITIRYEGFAGNLEWLTIVPEGAPDRTYAGYVYAPAGGGAGSVVYLPQVAGHYEVRVLVDRPAQSVIARTPLEIVDLPSPLPGAVMELAAPAVARQPIRVRYAGVPEIAGNWITIVAPGTPDAQYGVYVNPTGSAGEVTFQGQAAGAYELRFFVERPRRVLIARLPIMVE